MKGKDARSAAPSAWINVAVDLQLPLERPLRVICAGPEEIRQHRPAPGRSLLGRDEVELQRHFVADVGYAGH